MKIDWNKELLFKDQYGRESNFVAGTLVAAFILIISGLLCTTFAGKSSDPLNKLYQAGMEHEQIMIVSEQLGAVTDQMHTLAMIKSYSTPVLQAGVTLFLFAAALIVSIVGIAAYRVTMCWNNVRLQKKYDTHKKCFRPRQHRLTFTIGKKTCKCVRREAPPWWRYSEYAARHFYHCD